VERHRKAAERLVVGARWRGHKDRAVEELGEEREALYRDALIDLFHLEQDRVKPIKVEEKEMRAYYDAHRKEFFRTAARLVYHLFRRDEDPARPQDTVAFLASLKKRAEAGEAFSLLARRYSQSETRLTDGRLGTVGRGRLPAPLERVVFALPKGGISDPIRVQGGGILLEVADLVEEKQFPFEDVKLIIGRRLWDEAPRAWRRGGRCPLAGWWSSTPGAAPPGRIGGPAEVVP
jgi:parvulin-like peptidyl-prolyl isomerase